MAKCKGCGKEIVFIRTESGKSMPCDIDKIMYWEDKKAKGKIVTSNGMVISSKFDGEPEEATGIGYLPHWSTCPNAKEFKKGRWNNASF